MSHGLARATHVYMTPVPPGHPVQFENSNGLFGLFSKKSKNAAANAQQRSAASVESPAETVANAAASAANVAAKAAASAAKGFATGLASARKRWECRGAKIETRENKIRRLRAQIEALKKRNEACMPGSEENNKTKTKREK